MAKKSSSSCDKSPAGKVRQAMKTMPKGSKKK